MRAAHGVGGDLTDLESKFSQVQEGSTVNPEEGAKEVYNAMLPGFKGFLESQSG
jgi:hypothetical protein